jgi:hypothetical protein
MIEEDDEEAEADAAAAAAVAAAAAAAKVTDGREGEEAVNEPDRRSNDCDGRG